MAIRLAILFVVLNFVSIGFFVSFLRNLNSIQPSLANKVIFFVSICVFAFTGLFDLYMLIWGVLNWITTGSIIR